MFKLTFLPYTLDFVIIKNVLFFSSSSNNLVNSTENITCCHGYEPMKFGKLEYLTRVKKH